MTQKMKSKQIWFALTCVFALLVAVSLGTPRTGNTHTYKPEGGYVRSADIAIGIAEIILTSIYGNKEIKSEKPLVASLNSDGVWIIKGTLKPNRKGGVAEIWISKDSGAILKVTHEL